MKLVHFNGHTFNFMLQHVLTDQAQITVALDLKLKLVEVDVLKV